MLELGVWFVAHIGVCRAPSGCGVLRLRMLLVFRSCRAVPVAVTGRGMIWGPA